MVESQTGDRHRAGQSAGRLRSELQPGRRVRCAGLSLPADLLPAAGYYAAGMAISFGVGLGDGSGLGRRLGLRLRMGRQQQHQRSTTTTISIATPTSTAATATILTAAIATTQRRQPAELAATTGSTIRSTAAELPMANRATANKYGGTTRGASASDRQAECAAINNLAQQGGRQQAEHARIAGGAVAVDKAGRPATVQPGGGATG